MVRSHLKKHEEKQQQQQQNVCSLPSLSRTCAFYLAESFDTNNAHTGKQLPMCDFAQPCLLLTSVLKTHGMENHVEG